MGYKSLMKQPFWRLLQKPALARCHCLHATAAAEYEDIRRVGLRTPVTVIPNGVDVPKIEADKPRSRQIVFLSRIDPVKGLDLLLPAWTTIAQDYPDWELLIAGPLTHDYAGRIQELARRLATPRIRFLGEVLGPAKRSLLAGASLFVLPSYSENFGIAVAEALAHGLPVITTSVTPWAEIRSRGCGWYIPTTEDALRNALQAALSLPLPSLNAMGQAGRRWMKREYAWPQIAEKMRGTYDWLLCGGTVPDCVVAE
jgi:glycosyltransferase involved in cell wall biosynthesis